jgi:AcrR family transcriptional regulator
VAVARLTRAEAQQRNRTNILAAARAEFAERGFRDVKIDEIADRAELTRGAVYSNFPGKRALYFAVLANETAQLPALKPAETVRDAVSSFALVWVSQENPLAKDLVPQILAEESSRTAYAQLVRLNAILLGLSLQKVRPRVSAPFRRGRLATMVLTTLHGASQLTDLDPGLVEPFDVIGACEALAGLDLNDAWSPPVPRPAEPVSWNPPEAVDALNATPVDLSEGVVAFVGLRQLAMTEEIVRANSPVTVVIVTEDPAELGPLVRLNLSRLGTALRHTFGPEPQPDVRIVCDETGAIARAAGLAVNDRTVALRSVSSDRSAHRRRAPATPRSG